MSIFWLLAVGLLLLASVFVVLPLWLSAKGDGSGPSDQAESNLRLHEERLQELAQGLLAGDLTQSEHDTQVEDQSMVLLDDAEWLLGGIDGTEISRGAVNESKQTIAVSLALLILVSTAWYADFGWSQGALTELEFTERLKQKGDAPRAKADLEDLASGLKQIHVLSPDNEQVGFYLGQLYLTLGNFDRAAEIFASLAARYPEDGDLAVVLAESRYLQEGRQLTYDLRLLFERAVKLKPSSVKLLEILGMEAVKRGETARAKLFFERALTFAGGERAKIIATVLRGLPEVSESVETDQASIASKDPKPIRVTRRVLVTVTKDPVLDIKPESTLYVFAKAVSGPSMPLAVVKRRGSDLPLQVVLDESMAMMAGLSIADFDQITVTAKISESGLATPSPDDLSAESAVIGFDQNQAVVSLILSQGS